MNSPALPFQLLPEAWQQYQSGDLARAEALGHQALAAGQSQAEVFHLLGTVAYHADQLDTAIAHMGQAVQADPNNPNYQNNLGVFFTSAGQLVEAIACFQQLKRRWPHYAQAYNNLSFAFYKQGRFEDARTNAEQALRLWPGYAEAHNHLGLALLELDQPQDAAVEFQKALELKPGLAAVHRNLGSALEQQGRLAEATASIQQALRLAPDFAEAYSDLGDICKSQGQFTEAVAHLRQALRINPACAFAWWNLSQFEAQGLCRLTDDELSHVQALLETGKATLLDSSLLHLTIATVNDRRGAYDAAFDHYRQGNAHRQQWLRQSGRAFDPRAHRLLVDRLMTTFDEAFFRQPHPGGSGSAVPVFVVGMPRSGTTLVEQILSSHSQVGGVGEMKEMARLVMSLARQAEGAGGYPTCLGHLQEADLRSLADRYLARLTRGGGRTVGASLTR